MTPDTSRDVPPTQPAEEPTPLRPDLVEAIADLLQSASDWVRQEAGDIVRTKIVMPIQRLGLTISSAAAAGCLGALGGAFVAVAAFIFLGQWLTYPGALLLIGVLLLIGSGVFTAIKVRSIQR